MSDLNWQLRGACRAHPALDADAWFPTPADTPRAAIDVCRRDCPVLAACAAHAFENGETDGIWGGLTAADRKRLRRGPTRHAWDDCGTGYGAYQRHLKHDEEPCQACRDHQARLVRDRRHAREAAAITEGN